jgi:hypothetical protein
MSPSEASGWFFLGREPSAVGRLGKTIPHAGSCQDGIVFVELKELTLTEHLLCAQHPSAPSYATERECNRLSPAHLCAWVPHVTQTCV